MRLFEYEAKEVLKGYQIAVPAGAVAAAPDEIPPVTRPVMLKAQIPLGGRGKAGGIIEAKTADEAREGVARLLREPVRGILPRKVLVEEKAEIAREFFMAVTWDTVAKCPLAIFSAEGGVDIEELAARDPEKVRRAHFSVRGRLPRWKAREMVSEAGISGKLLIDLGNVLSRLGDVFLECDATLAEVNPLALTRDGRLVALDCHLDLDDDALFRHRDIAGKAGDEARNTRVPTAFELRAAAVDAGDHRGVAGRVIEFDGTLGLIIGGGGASLTAFDAVRAHGGKPANYCEIGGNPSVKKVKELTTLLLEKPGVTRVGVIMNVVSNTRVDLVARGVVKGILAAGRVPSETLAVFRVPGAWEEEGAKILGKYGVAFSGRTVSIDEAARIAVLGAQGRE